MVWSQCAPGDPGENRRLAPGVDSKRGRRRCRRVCPRGGEASWVRVASWWALGPEGCVFWPGFYGLLYVWASALGLAHLSIKTIWEKKKSIDHE